MDGQSSRMLVPHVYNCRTLYYSKSRCIHQISHLSLRRVLSRLSSIICWTMRMLDGSRGTFWEVMPRRTDLGAVDPSWWGFETLLLMLQMIVDSKPLAGSKRAWIRRSCQIRRWYSGYLEWLQAWTRKHLLTRCPLLHCSIL